MQGLLHAKEASRVERLVVHRSPTWESPSFIIKKISFSLSHPTNHGEPNGVWGEPKISSNKNDRVLEYDEENFPRLCSIKVSPVKELLTKKNLYDTKSSPFNSLGKYFCITFPFSCAPRLTCSSHRYEYSSNREVLGTRQEKASFQRWSLGEKAGSNDGTRRRLSPKSDA